MRAVNGAVVLYVALAWLFLFAAFRANPGGRISPRRDRYGWVCRAVEDHHGVLTRCKVEGDEATRDEADRAWRGHYYRTHYRTPTKPPCTIRRTTGGRW